MDRTLGSQRRTDFEMTIQNTPFCFKTPASWRSPHQFRRIKASNLKFHQLVVNGGFHFQDDGSNSQPSTKASLLYLHVYPSKSGFSFGNTFSVAKCYIFFGQTSANGNDPTEKSLEFYAANLVISVHAVIIAGDCLLIDPWETAPHPWTTVHITMRTPSGDLTQEGSTLCHFYKPAEEFEYLKWMFKYN
jgi:hypothetical protein